MFRRVILFVAISLALSLSISILFLHTPVSSAIDINAIDINAPDDNSDKETDNTNANFLSWFAENGGKASGVGLSHFPSMGRGIIADADLDDGSEVLFVPKRLILSLESLRASADPIHNRIAAIFADDDQTAVIAALLWEKAKGPQSFYHPYIEVLPRTIHNLLQFEDNELRELQNQEVESSASFAQKGQVELQSSLSKATESFWLDKAPITLADLNWATSVVDSRALRFRGKVYLTPFADMFNYAPHPDPRVASDGNFFLNHHVLSEEGIKITSDRAQAKGEQVFEDYGDNTDTNYAMYHGFVADVNPFTCVKVQAPAFMDITSEKMLDLLKILQFKFAPGGCIDKNMKFSKALIVYLTTLSFSSTERKRCVKLANVTNPNFGQIFEKCGYRDVTDFLYKYMDDVKEFGLHGAKELAEDVMNDFEGLENRFMNFVSKWLEQIHPKFLTTIEYDEAELEGLVGKHKARHEHKALAVRFRLKQKKMWRLLCDAFGSKCDIDPVTAAAAMAVKKADQDVADKKSNKKILDEFSVGMKLGETLEEKVQAFNKWFSESCDKEGAVHAIEAAVLPRYRIGTTTTEDVEEDEVYLQVPLTIIMDVQKARNDPDFGAPLSEFNEKALKNRDSFTELLLYLIDQRFVKMQKSQFWAYLSLLPKPSDLDVPSLWTTEEVVERLSPSFLAPQVMNYRERMVRSYQALLKMEGLSSLFPEGLLTFEKFRWAFIILDSRSIWWKSERHLVPMLDFINCIEGPSNPSRVHSTVLDDSGRFAVTKAGWDFKAGTQLFENYGQPNLIYFQYHGFSLTGDDGGNTHDCVHFELNITRDEGQRINWDSAADVIKRLRLRQQAISISCLNEASKIPESVWLFLALKMNTFDALRDSDELGFPTRDGLQFLVRMISDRLAAYDSYTSRHIASRKFIRSEEAILRNLKKGMNEILQKDFDVSAADEL